MTLATLFSGLLSVDSGYGKANAQGVRNVVGIVTSENDKDGVVGATVIAVGTNVGTVTDINGRFSLTLPAGTKKLKISSVGLETLVVAVSADMRIFLKSDARQLDEVMVVAYGTTKKSTFTGSAATVKMETIGERPITDISSALNGAVAGVNVTTTSGMPGETSDIRIRGIGSFSASSSPLIVLDGVIYENSLTSINPGDIETITVLKDAASTALYGARAANGVLMVTSKRGREGKARVNVKFNQGVVARQGSDYSRLGVNDYCEIYWESLYNTRVGSGSTSEESAIYASNNLMTKLGYNPFLNVASNEVVGTDGKFNTSAVMAWADDTDWEDAVSQLGNRTDASVSVSGGSKDLDYYTSFGYTDESGYIVGSNFKRYTVKSNINGQVNKWLRTGLTMDANFSESKGQQSESSNTYSNPFLFVRYVAPIYPIHLHDATTGEYILDSNGNKRYDFGQGYDDGTYTSPQRTFAQPTNPAIEQRERNDGYTRKSFSVKGFAEIRFLKDFTFTVNASATANNYLSTHSDVVYEEKENEGYSTKISSSTSTSTFNELLNYNKSFGLHNLDVLLGHENYRYEYNYLYASMKSQIMDGNSELVNYTEVNVTPTSHTNKYRTEGYFSRVSYDYDHKYFGSLSFRRDGSSRFHKDARWGNFWSIGGGWTLKREKFLADVNWVDNLKLRLSYGEVGNDDVGGYYPWLASYISSNNGAQAGYIQGSLGNRNLKWEVSRNFDVALEFSLFDRISGSLEYFYRQSSNLLFSVPLSLSTGFDSQDQNAGTMYNKGVELQLNTRIIKGSTWNLDLNINGAYIKNEITELPVDAFINNSVFKIEEGHSRYEFYLKQWAGVDPATGSSIYVPAEGATQLVTVDGKEYTTSVDEAEYAYCGQGIPKFTGSVSPTLRYKDISLSASFYFQLGGKVYDTAYMNLMTPGYRENSNLHTDILNRWQKVGDVTDVPRVSDGSDSDDLTGNLSSRWLTSSNMIELSSIVLSYDFPKQLLQHIGISSARVYVSGENVFYISAREGLYPRMYESGYEYNTDTYAPARAFTAGINITF